MRSTSLSFTAIIVLLGAFIGVTTPYLVEHTRIGIEFRGGYELLLEALPHPSAHQVSHDDIVKTADILSERANRLGVSEPSVNILGDDLIRVELAGISTGDKIAAQLRDPSDLPVRLVEKYSETVGGVLGQGDLQATMEAGGIALALIFLFLAVTYRGPGLIAIFTIVVFLWSLLAVFNVINATLSLSAIVAFVLGIGIASGANILSFERMRDEFSAGTPVIQAIDRGTRAALRTIFEANVTVLICSVILLLAGIGPIRGFALTTILATMLSFAINALLAGRLLKLRYAGQMEIRPLFGSSSSQSPHARRAFDYLRWSKIVIGSSLAFGLLGAVMLASTPLNLDIEFKAGTALDIKIAESITQDKATQIIIASGIAPATVAIGGLQQDQIAVRFDDVLDTAQVNAVIGQFKSAYGPAVTFAENTADPAVARHLAVQSIWVVLLALTVTFVFILIRFDWRFAIASLVSVLNAMFFVISVFSIVKLEIDITFIAATLTVIGYALNESIVVFDRIRENLISTPLHSVGELNGLVNESIRQVQRRSIYTVLTVLAGSACLFFFGAEPLQMFSIAIFLGLVCGTYSSLCIAPRVWRAFAGRTRTIGIREAA